MEKKEMLINGHASKKRMQDKVTISRLIIVPLKGCKQFKYLGTTLTHQNSIQEEI
jgi:hypothetical protein